MKSLFIFAGFLLIQNCSYAQNIEVLYEHFIILKKAEKQLDENPSASSVVDKYFDFLKNSYTKKKLTVTPLKSACIDLGLHLRDSSITPPSSYSQVNRNYFFDFSQNVMYQTARDIPGIMYKDSLIQTITWTLTEETKTILGYVCQKATGVKTKPTVNQKADTKNAPAQIEAWFCPKIATSAGPAFYFGLPGLILELVDKHNNYVATQVKVLNKEKCNVVMPTEPKTVSKQEFSGLIEGKVMVTSSEK